MEHRDGTRMDPDRERALVERAASDPAAFAELYDFYLPRIFGYLVRRVEERAVAEDLTATTFERALGAVRSGAFRNDAFGGWLYRVAANALVDHLRRGRRYLPLGVRAGDDDRRGEGDALASAADDRALAAFGAAIERDALARAIAELPDGHRRVVLLRYVDGFEAGELADALGCSPATAAVRLHRALRALRAELLREAIDVA
jgi:RNA polymerase sigma-70 factor (ECF subfamily)